MMKVSLIRNTYGFLKPLSQEFYSFFSHCAGHGRCRGAMVLLRVSYECCVLLICIYYVNMTSREVGS